MKYVAIFTILLVNCGLFFVASILTIPGDGSDGHMELKWAIGFGWIAIVHLTSLVLSTRGRSEIAILLAAVTLPIAMVGLMIAGAAFGMYASFKPDSPEFKAACQSTGVTYFHEPNSPVRSIAYDWPSDAYPPQLSLFKMDERRNMSYKVRGHPSFPAQIEFTEARCCLNVGPPANGIGPFVRHPRAGPYYGVSELSADSLVIYKNVEAPGVASESVVQRWQVSVQDRRDGQVLAELRYAIDVRNNRACGETSPGVMDERAFVLRAVDVR